MKLGLIFLSLTLAAGCGRKDTSDDDGDDADADTDTDSDTDTDTDSDTDTDTDTDTDSDTDADTDADADADSEIAKIQQRDGYTDGDTVTVSGVVTSPDIGSGFFMQDAAGAWTGIYVYDGNDVDVEQGDAVEVTAVLGEYYDLTELDATEGSVTVTGTGTIPSATLIDASDASDLEAYEGVLVKIEGVTVSEGADEYGEWMVDDTFKIDNLFHAVEPTVGDSYNSITGVMNYNYNEFKIAPREASDLVE